MGRIVRSLLLFALLVILPTNARAGTLCGTVTDRQTSGPVAHAGIFLRTPAGAYTGIYGATDAGGSFCIAHVPPGTYDIEVLVDDYRVAYLRGVTVTGAVTGVAIGAGVVHARLAPPAPNPAHEGTRLRWTQPTAGPARLAIYDALGRFVRGWSAVLPAGEYSKSWDLRDPWARRSCVPTRPTSRDTRPRRAPSGFH